MSAAHAEKELIAARDAAAKATKAGTNAINEAKRAAEAFRREQDQGLRAQLQAVSAIHQQAGALEDQVLLFGQSKTALEDLTIARLEEQAAMLRGFDGSQEQVEAIEREIEARQRLRTAIGSLEQKEAERQQWEDWARDVEQIFNRVGQSLTDAIFDGGKSAKDLLRDLFKGLTFNILINPVMNQMQGWVTNQLGGLFGYQNPQQQGGGILGLAQHANTLNTLVGGIYQAMTGASVGASNLSLGYANLVGMTGGDSIGALIAANGGWEGALSGLSSATSAAVTAGALSAAPTVAASLSTSFGTAATTMASTSFTASLGGGAAAAGGGAAAAGAGGLMSGIAAAAPWIGGALAIGSAFGLFGDDEPRTRHAQMSHADLGADGTFSVSTWDDRQSRESQNAAAAYATEAVRNATELFGKIGIDAAFTRFTTLMESSILGDKQGVGSSGTIRIGDLEHEIGLAIEPSWTKHGVGGWSEAEMLPRLMTDVQLTILEAFQAAGDQLPSVLSGMLEGVDIRALGAEQAQALAQQFSVVVEQVSSLQAALEQLPFANLRDLSFDAAAGLIAAAGGLENLNAGMTSYFQNFYSEEEKLEWATKQIGDAFGELGLTMPDVTQGAELAKAAYRDLVESLDVTTEEGQRAYATLMTLSGGFHELVTGMDQLADAAARAAEEQRRAAEQLRQQLMGDLSTAYNAVVQAGQREIARLQESFGATDSALSAYRSAVQRLESEFNSLFAAIDRGIQALRGTGAAFDAQYHQARAVISTTLLTGQLPQTADLSEAIRVAQQGVMGQRFASREDQQRAYLTLANQIEGIKAIAEPELDTAKQTLSQLETQYRLLRGMSEVGEDSLSALEAQLRTAMSTEEVARRQVSVIEQQLEEARRQYDALTGIDTSIKDLATAMREFAAAAAAAAARPPAGGGGSGGGASGGGGGGSYDPVTNYLTGNPDLMAAYLADGGGDYMSPAQWAQQHWDRYGKYEDRPVGLRSYDVGTAYVPYDMNARVHQGEIIIRSREADILRNYGIAVKGGGSSRETEQLLREQLAEVRQQNRYLYEMVKSGKRNERNTEDVANAIAHGDSDGGVVVVM